MNMDSAEQRLEDLRTAMYKIIDPINNQGRAPNIIQGVLLILLNTLLDILECEFLDVEETEVE